MWLGNKLLTRIATNRKETTRTKNQEDQIPVTPGTGDLHSEDESP